MSDDEDRIRKEAHELWVGEGRPEGRADAHWTQAREIVALRDSYGSALKPLDQTIDEPVEPAVAFENQAETPGLDDQGNNQSGPSRQAAEEIADLHPLEVDEKPAAAKRKRGAPKREDQSSGKARSSKKG